MRSLGQPQVLKSAVIAALICAVACYPRVCSAPERVYPVWYMEAVLFLGSIVLWGFVFAWHTKYTQRPVFTLRIGPLDWAAATLCGAGGALFWHFWIDPFVRARAPADYPATLYEWLGTTLFTLACTQLFVVFSPFAWLMRLFQKPGWATALTVVFGLVVMLIRQHSAPLQVPATWLAGLLALRLTALLLSVFFFLRGGILLASWWVLLLQSRHLLELG